jgi:hypothetical protein
MKPLYFLAISSALALAPTKPSATYVQSPNIERERIEVIYLPNNTCHISVPAQLSVENYRDYVRACLNNRHLRIKINKHQTCSR